MKDALGRNIEVGDIVFYGYNCYEPIIGLVDKTWPVWIRIRYMGKRWEDGTPHLMCTTAKRPECAIVINELYNTDFFKTKFDDISKLTGISINTTPKEISTKTEKDEKPEEWQ